MSIDLAFPSEDANKLAHLESYNKHLFRPNTYLHKWWARRSGTTFRHILKQLCHNPEDRNYYSPGGLEGKTILDPMMGGGTTLHEAVRLNASVIGFDIDPIPILQAKASLAEVALENRQRVFDKFLVELESSLKEFFITHCPQCDKPAEVLFTLYGSHRRCDCHEAIFVDSFVVREEPDGTVIRLTPDGLLLLPNGEKFVCTSMPLREKSERTCTECGNLFRERESRNYRDRYVPLVVVGHCKEHLQFFKHLDTFDLETLDRARERAKSCPIPVEKLSVPRGPKSDDLIRREIRNFSEVFSARQLLYIAAAKEILSDLNPDESLWLTLLISTSLEFNSLLCGYKGADKRRPGAIRHVFSHHAYSFPHTAIENNPIFSQPKSGTLRLLFEDRIVGGSFWADNPIERKLDGERWSKITIQGETDRGHLCSSYQELSQTVKGVLVEQRSSSVMELPDDSVDHVVTDPPYYDSVQYSDLATFFRVWLAWFLPDAANWEYVSSGSAVAGNGDQGNVFQQVLTSIWRECHRVLKKPMGRLIFTFHHWQSDAWARLTLSLKNAGFQLSAAYTIHSENPSSVHIHKLRAITHDSILVLKPVEAKSSHKIFAEPTRIETEDSFTFTENCAKILGFCLESELRDEEIHALWKRLIE